MWLHGSLNHLKCTEGRKGKEIRQAITLRIISDMIRLLCPDPWAQCSYSSPSAYQPFLVMSGYKDQTWGWERAYSSWEGSWGHHTLVLPESWDGATRANRSGPSCSSPVSLVTTVRFYLCLKQRKYGAITSVTDELINLGMKTVNQARSKLYKYIWFTGPRIPFYDQCPSVWSSLFIVI